MVSPRPSDIIVVGAGVIGCAIAYELARRGASVQVVDGRTAGMGATQASAGVLAPSIEADYRGPLFELGTRSLALYDEVVSRVSSDALMPVHYVRTGTIEIATSEDRMASMAATASALAARGFSVDVLDAAEARAAEPALTDEAIGGVATPSYGFVAAAELTRALAAAACCHGAQIVDGRRILRIARAAGDLVVATDRGALVGNAVVLAAGSWSGQIEIEGVSARVPVRPVRGQLLHLSWPGLPVRRVVWGERCYLVPWADGTLLVGATVEEAGFDERTTVAGVRDLLDAACDLVPGAWSAGFVGARVGLRPASGDELPIIGPSEIVPNLMYATGHYRTGVLMAPLTGQIVADALLEGRMDPAFEVTRPQRFGAL